MIIPKKKYLKFWLSFFVNKIDLNLIYLTFKGIFSYYKGNSLIFALIRRRARNRYISVIDMIKSIEAGPIDNLAK